MDFYTWTWTVRDLELGATTTDSEEVVKSLRGLTNRKTFRNTRGGSKPVWPMDLLLTESCAVRQLIERHPVSTVSVDQNPTVVIDEHPTRLNRATLPHEAHSIHYAQTSLLELDREIEMYNKVLMSSIVHDGTGVLSNEEFNGTEFFSQTDTLIAFSPIEEYQRHATRSVLRWPWVAMQGNLTTAEALGYNEIREQTLIPPVEFSGSLAPPMDAPSFYSNDGYFIGHSVNNAHLGVYDGMIETYMNCHGSLPLTTECMDAYAVYNLGSPAAYGEYIC
ncbi:hypothetical protein MSAN_00355300 [Mycena sanguinolenta]|uniref:Uncharacterized protein n=1 Tax=Mycena sanguinolenta TaxID=230812 RepID=A0A8H6ZBR5_9AGAR|nr:hypothetical protein MSAN_00355300 [Mycena sanguinolenta]